MTQSFYEEVLFVRESYFASPVEEFVAKNAVSAAKVNRVRSITDGNAIPNEPLDRIDCLNSIELRIITVLQMMRNEFR